MEVTPAQLLCVIVHKDLRIADLEAQLAAAKAAAQAVELEAARTALADAAALLAVQGTATPPEGTQ